MTTFILITAFFTLGVGIAVLWANPSRAPNQAFSLTSLILFNVLILTFISYYVGNFYSTEISPSWIAWIRARGAIAALLPWSLWILKESFLTTNQEKTKIVRRSLPWFGASLVIGAINLSGWYVEAHPFSLSIKPGPLFVFRNFAMMAMFVILITQSQSQIKRTHGVQRIEMQFFSLNLGITGFISLSLSFLGALSREIYILRILSILIILSGYFLSAWAVAFYRIFDFRHVLLSILQRIGLFVSLGIGILLVAKSIEFFFPLAKALLWSSLICSSAGFWLDRKSRTWMDLDGERALSDTRRATIQIALDGPNLEGLVSAFETLLSQRTHSSLTRVMLDTGESFDSPGLKLVKKRPAYTALCEAGWATPESLERRRKTNISDDLKKYIYERNLGLIIASPIGSRKPSLLIAFEKKAQLWPFTYPEIRRLQNVAELMDSILTRSRLTTQAALTAKMEHLAMMSRGLAHDLKNLITPVSSFLIHTDDHFPSDSPEGEVHSAARRSVRIMTDYIREALFFSERLTPHFETVDLTRLFQAVSEITASRAARRGVEVFLPGHSAVSLTADAVLLQRLLGNLVSNAIDASNSGQKIVVSLSTTESGRVRFQVTDEGAGIAPEHLSRIFDPYFTTKEFGEDVRGFGLGLTICQKIAELHGGTISVESQIRRGTTVAVDLPSVPVTPPRQEAAFSRETASLRQLQQPLSR